MADLLEIEKWPAFNTHDHLPMSDHGVINSAGHGMYACCECLHLHPKDDFSLAMVKGKRGKNGGGSLELKAGRFCIPCGVEMGRYNLDTRLQVAGADGSFAGMCSLCNSFVRIPEERAIPDQHCPCCYGDIDGKIIMNDVNWGMWIVDDEVLEETSRRDEEFATLDDGVRHGTSNK